MSAQKLPVLDMTGVSNGGALEAILSPVPASDEQSQLGAERPAPKRKSATPKEPSVKPSSVPSSDFYGGGALEQTSIAVAPDLFDQLADLTAETRLAATAVFTAILHSALPADSQEAVSLAIHERADHPGKRREYNLRLPAALRERLDELLHHGGLGQRRGARADLVNACVRRAMPVDAETCGVLVAEFKRAQELARMPVV